MDDTRTRIITATNELFRRNGYHGSSLTAISKAAEAPTGSLYHFFPGGKVEIARATLLETGDAFRELFEAIADESIDITSGVAAFFNGAADALEATDYIDLCPMGSVAREVASTHESLRAATATVFESWTSALANRLIREGTDPTEAERVATSVVAMVEGGFVIARSRRDASALRALGEHAATLVELALRAT